MIAKEAMQNWHNSIIVRNRSGERLLDVWAMTYWFYTPQNNRAATDRRTNRQVGRLMHQISHAIFDAKYTFYLQVPAFLQVNHDLREEGREALLEVARAELAHAETRNNFDRQHCNKLTSDFILAALTNSFEKLGTGPLTVTDEEVHAIYKRTQRQAVEMVCATLCVGMR